MPIIDEHRCALDKIKALALLGLVIAPSTQFLSERCHAIDKPK